VEHDISAVVRVPKVKKTLGKTLRVGGGAAARR
jgi:hypothetical protein